MKQQRMTLLGGSENELRVDGGVLEEALKVLREGMARAARFSVEGVSVKAGPRPSWLEDAVRYDVTGLHKGSAALDLESLPLKQSAPSLFAVDPQMSVFPQPTVDPDLADATPFDLLGEHLEAILSGNDSLARVDRGLLEVCARFGGALKHGFHGVRFDGLRRAGGAMVLRQDDIVRLEVMSKELPAPQAVRLSGRLETIHRSKPDVVLQMKDGSHVIVHLDNHDTSILVELFHKKVVLTGQGQYHPSGKLVRVDAATIQPADKGDAIFERTPRPNFGDQSFLAGQPRVQGGIQEFFGKWDGDETEEDLLAMLAEIR